MFRYITWSNISKDIELHPKIHPPAQQQQQQRHPHKWNKKIKNIHLESEFCLTTKKHGNGHLNKIAFSLSLLHTHHLEYLSALAIVDILGDYL